MVPVVCPSLETQLLSLQNFRANGSATRDIGFIIFYKLFVRKLSQLGLYVRLLGSNTAVEISMGNVSNAVLHR